METATLHSSETRKAAAKPFDFSALSDDAFMRQTQVLQVVPFSPATLWRKSKAGTFCKSVRLSDRITGWRAGDVRQWLAAQAKGV
jgi:predicted DNA-binding transcriptional regulator AlpA